MGAIALEKETNKHIDKRLNAKEDLFSSNQTTYTNYNSTERTIKTIIENCFWNKYYKYFIDGKVDMKTCIWQDKRPLQKSDKTMQHKRRSRTRVACRQPLTYKAKQRKFRKKKPARAFFVQ